MAKIPTDLNPDSTVWRYMPFKRFAELVTLSSLFFSRPVAFSDANEGQLLDVHRRALAAKTTELDQRGYVARLFGEPEEWNKFRRLESFGYSVVSCWTLKEYEDDLLWKVYAGGTDSVAVKTTVRLLAATLPEDCTIGRVVYRDPTTPVDPPAGIAVLFDKDIAYASETELRCVIDLGSLVKQHGLLGHERLKRIRAGAVSKVWERVAEVEPSVFKEKGALVKVDVRSLVQTVVLCPKAIENDRRCVEGVLKAAGLAISVEPAKTTYRMPKPEKQSP